MAIQVGPIFEGTSLFDIESWVKIMVKITTKLYRPSDLLEVINTMETVLASHESLTASDIVIDLRKKGYKIVKVDDGIKPN